MIKTLIYEGTKARGHEGTKGEKAPTEREIVVVLVRGDHEVNETKLMKVAGKVELAGDATIQKLTGAAVGFAGPHTLAASGVKYRLIVDPAVAAMRNAVTGANKTGYHVKNINPGRDFAIASAPSGSDSRAPVTVADVRTVVDGDLAPTGSGSPLRLRKSIEIGHVFKLGTKYSDAMKATFLDADGKPKSLIMGCYGIGLNRIMAAAIEAHHDENGIIWPMTIAPFQVLVIALDPRLDDVMQLAGKVHDELTAAGIDVLFDDRDERAGFKFKDADLIGVPVRITIGKKGLAEGVVELTRRETPKDVEKVAPTDVVKRATEMVKSAKA